MTLLNRRELLFAGAASLATGAMARGARAQGEPEWHDVREWGVEGKGWKDTARYFDRLPARAQQTVRPDVWNLSRHSAGMAVQFETDSPSIQVRYSLLSASLAMPHMPATGVSGVDLYGADGHGAFRWIGVSRPSAKDVVATLASGLDPGVRRYTLYLPLYNGVDSLEIGVSKGATFRGLPPRERKLVVFYGTSIMHGACASRPGISMTAILGRRLNVPTLNLGFSGNGRMEKEVGAIIGELDAAVFAIDCLPNMSPEQVAERAEPLVRQLRTARPNAAIVLVEDRTFTNSEFYRGVRETHEKRRKALREAYEHLKSSGMKRLFYLGGDRLLGGDGEAATDGSHPNDLGMVRYADAYEPVLRKALG